MTDGIDVRWPSQQYRYGLRTRMSLLLESCALARGLSTTRTGRWMFVADTDPGRDRIGFFGTMSQETSRSAVRISQDRVMRKGLLEAHQIPVPDSEVFGHDQAEAAVEYAAKLTEGAVVKPQLRGKFMRRPALTSPVVQTRISRIRDRHGAGRPYLIEQWHSGELFTCYVVGDEVVSIVRRDKGHWDREVFRAQDPRRVEAPRQLFGLAVRVRNALPPVPHVAVNVRVPDEAGPDGAVVVSLSTEFGIIGGRAPQEWSTFLADRMVAHAARSLESTTGSPARHCSLQLTLAGVHDPAGTFRAVHDSLNGSRVQGTVIGTTAQQVEGRLAGTPGELVAFAALAWKGRFGGKTPQLTGLNHTNAYSELSHDV